MTTTLSTTRRSLDGGFTWQQVDDLGDYGLYEVPLGSPWDGRVLTGALVGIAYSTDRGGSFTEAEVPGQGTGSWAGAHDFVALPPGSSAPGRVLAAGRWGVNLSDDGGERYRESGLWRAVYYVGERLGVVEQEGGDVRALLLGRISGQEGTRAWWSDDGGEAWGPEGGMALPEGPPFGVGGGAKAVLSLGGATALAVLGRGTIYRTNDAGSTWAAVGRAPEISDSIFLAAAALGPEGRLYVGLAEGGTARGWVWRTGEVVTAAAEPPPAPEEAESLGLSVSPNPARGAAEATLSLVRPSAVRVVLLDSLGREVAVLHDGPLGAGRHALSVEAGSLPPGVYVVRVAAGEAVATQPVTLMP
ncbi:MAG: hypothetical protein R3181_05115 [Rubricoccaceae bacterium]|nr:hypothetical protein [Rubricoccaceae bacterium]